MAVGIELPKHYLKKEWLTMFMFLLPIMIFMWLVSGLFIWAMVPPINYLESLVIAACVCPTDPILANSVVKGRFAEKHVPAHIRNALSAESGANDGMGFPFLFLAIFLLGEDSVGKAVGKWVYETCLFQILLSCVIGVVVGWVARKILQWSERHHLIDKPSFLCFAIALALFLMSMTGFSGSDDVLACFAAGNAFSWDDWFRQETEEAHFQEVIDMMLNLAVFVYIGAIIPWSDFGNAALGLTPWRLVVLAVLILLFRRLPIVLALKPVMPAMKTYRDAAFSGWFGPMGVGAVFLSKIAKEELQEVYHGQPEPVAVHLINPIVLFIVLSSVLVHGTTIPLFKLGKRIRTRTLSITSTGGSSQVLRLPKIQFGQNISLRGRGDDDRRSRHSADPEAMSQLQRNTLMNTIQYDRKQEGSNGTTLNHSPDAAYVDMHDDDQSDGDLSEEDYLPGEGDDATTEMRHLEVPRSGSAPMLESQSIRFLEPVKPRNTSSQANIERNEASVSSLRSWRNRNRDREDHQDDDESNAQGSSMGGLRQFFRRSKDTTATSSSGGDEDKAKQLRGLFSSPTTEAPPSDKEPEEAPQTAGAPHSEKEAEQEADKHPDHAEEIEEEFHKPSHPRLEVWQEAHKVIIEDSQDELKQTVIDKKDPNWKSKMERAVQNGEEQIREDEHKEGTQ
ncbi:Sodium/hydrogen exchanger family-domain-containing protein [Radiomyces spectabilis]|uniref:Sodium/hydrogen exchanger family-domain-containing protein n=1 Tax=Radiomyces spectabilis TaxID=64574 RepID=UPI00222023D4|nr:Sodium/hydrogen exchanger family-domain-containing protein [Radiomyces spectabilis]KAI8366074.1 Sodium/hydrogen exchanger family-domain-containing protein [Radiomyces spectabilis]